MLQTAYLYEWKPLEAASPTPEPTAEPTAESPTPKPTAEEAEPDEEDDRSIWERGVYDGPWYSGEGKGERFDDIIEVRKTADGEYIPTGYTITDCYGKVLIRHGYDPLCWEMATFDTVVYEGDVIWVSYDSGVILGSEGGYVRAKDQASIVIANNEDAPSKIDLLYGKIVGNLKQMWRSGGQIDWEMSQAVLGIKGTTYILEEGGTSSTIKVLEGTAEVTPRGSEPISVSGEEAITIADGVVGEVQPLDLDEELSTWDEDTQTFIREALEEADGSDAVRAEKVRLREAEPETGGSADDRPANQWMPYLAGAGLALALVAALGVVWVVARKSH